MLTPREAFKVAFLQRCADEGLTLEETHDRVKTALHMTKESGGEWAPWAPLNYIAKSVTDVGEDMAKTVGKLGLGAAILGPPAIGYGAGRLAASATDVTDEDAEEAKKRQLIAEYQRLATDVRRRRKSPI